MVFLFMTMFNVLSEEAENIENEWQLANKEKVRMMLTRLKYLIGSSGCDDS